MGMGTGMGMHMNIPHGQMQNPMMQGYNPYMGMGMMGMGMGQGQGLPYGEHAQAAGSGEQPAPTAPGPATAQETDWRTFDAGKMKAGRMGHYGYLEGRGVSA